MQFIKFIDHYPTDSLSMNYLEPHIIDYFDNHKIPYDLYIKDLCIRYGFKSMYLHLHGLVYPPSV
jgi:hypothetical protein